MDAGPLPPARPPHAPWRPENCDKIGLVLQGGGALGAYQAGVYQAMHEAGLEPDWVAGVSIGGINSALIAGNPPERRLERLREFWETITARPTWSLFTLDGDEPRKARNSWSALMTTSLGQPGFFTPNVPNPWLSLRGAKTATAFYDSAPLRETLLRLVDFDLLNRRHTRYACGAVNVLNGNFAYFDNHKVSILPEHVMASGALPPALPMVCIGTDHYWDGGLVSNTPLQHVLENCGGDNMVIFQVDLFSARGALPRDMYDVMSRQKDIQYSSRTVEDAAQAIAAKPVPAAARLRELIITIHRMNSERYVGDSKLHEMVEIAMEESWEVCVAHMQRLTETIGSVIAEGAASGDFDAPDVPLAAMCTCTAMMRFFHPQMIAQAASKPGPSLDQMVDFVLAGLASRGKAGK